MKIELNEGQQKALGEILASEGPGNRHLVTGEAGAGKTYLMIAVARHDAKKGRRLVATAPTHKAVSVLEEKMREAGCDNVDCMTIQSLLSLKPVQNADRVEFHRWKFAPPVDAPRIVLDETGMVGKDMNEHTKLHLPLSHLVMLGDPAQLPPVGEVISETFSEKSRSHLTAAVRQAQGPLLDALRIIRVSQSRPGMDYSWLKAGASEGRGVFRPDDPERWLKKAFMSSDFAASPDAFRFVAWRNSRVAEVNAKVRRWRYGDAPEPFTAGERAVVRAPIIYDGRVDPSAFEPTPQFSTNEEADVLDVQSGEFRFYIPETHELKGWHAEVPTWNVTLKRKDGQPVVCYMIRAEKPHLANLKRLKLEASEDKSRWAHFHAYNSALANLQSIYAMTVHNSQGSTFGTCFVDVPDIAGRARSNELECKQLLYTAGSRPKERMVVVG